MNTTFYSFIIYRNQKQLSTMKQILFAKTFSQNVWKIS